jgi:hypothetical protein
MLTDSIKQGLIIRRACACERVTPSFHEELVAENALKRRFPELEEDADVD